MTNMYSNIIYGTAIGDALGLPFEGMSRRRLAKFDKDHSGYHFFFNKGFVSDDTEHTFFVASALANANDDPAAFTRLLRWKLMLWLLSIPIGTGKATLISIIKMWLGFPSTKTAYFSAGNGPAMRVALIGCYYKDDDERLKAFVRASTSLTHSDPKAFTAALAVAKTVQYLATENRDKDELLKLLGALSDCSDWQTIISDLSDCLGSGKSLEEFCLKRGMENGISGYCYQSVPAAIYAVLIQAYDFQNTITDLIKAGGDTDTTAAIAASILAVANPDFDDRQQQNLVLFPHSKQKIAALSLALEKRQKHAGIAAFGPLILIRNLFMIFMVFIHIFRRLLPPY